MSSTVRQRDLPKIAAALRGVIYLGNPLFPLAFGLREKSRRELSASMQSDLVC